MAFLLDAADALRLHRSWPRANTWSVTRRRRHIEGLATIERRTLRLLRIAHLRGKRAHRPS